MNELQAPRARAAGGAWMMRWAGASAVALAAFLALPLLSLLLRAAPSRLAAELTQPAVLQALALSLATSVCATLVVVALGMPVAYLLATRSFAGKRALEALIDLPMVLPPTVAGFALLMAFGRSGLAGGALHLFGISLPFTTPGVVVAQVFMAAPFFIAPARAGFASVDRGLLDAAATLRAREAFAFRHVMLPLSRRPLVAGAAMAGARALGEFGATITFAGNLPGRTQTMPLAVYMALQSDLDAAIVLSVLLLVMSLGLLFGLRAASSAPPRRGARA
ncbi:MAG: ABC transporter permease [Candidatus Eiseniibacteriota bacterium]